MTTFRLSEYELKIIEGLKLWLQGIEDMSNLSTDRMWNEKTADPAIPDWVRNAQARLDETVFSSYSEHLGELKLSPRSAGFAKGALRAGVEKMNAPVTEVQKQASRRVRLSPKAKRKLNQVVNDFLIRVGYIEVKDSNWIDYFPRRAVRYFNKIENGSSAQQIEFKEAEIVGLKAADIGKQACSDATEIYLLLVMFWRIVVRFESVTQLHLWLGRFLGPRVGEKKRVEKICERIGLSLTTRGRPRKNPTPALPG